MCTLKSPAKQFMDSWFDSEQCVPSDNLEKEKDESREKSLDERLQESLRSLHV